MKSRFILTVNGRPVRAVMAATSVDAILPFLEAANPGDRISCRTDESWLATSTPEQRAQLAEAMEKEEHE